MSKVIRERVVEQHLKDSVEAHGGMAINFHPSTRGIPDRVVILNGHTVFVELKRPGEKPQAHQLNKHRQIRESGGIVYVIDTKEGVDELVAHYTQQPSSQETTI